MDTEQKTSPTMSKGGSIILGRVALVSEVIPQELWANLNEGELWTFLNVQNPSEWPPR